MSFILTILTFIQSFPFLRTAMCTTKALWTKVWWPAAYSSIGSPARQGYFAEGRLRVIQSSLALAANEEQALVRWERLPSYSERDWCEPSVRAAELTPSPRRLALQRQAGRGSVLTPGVIVTKCLTTVAELSEFRSGSRARTEGSRAAAR